MKNTNKGYKRIQTDTGILVYLDGVCIAFVHRPRTWG
jgi:hypothetical protein